MLVSLKKLLIKRAAHLRSAPKGALLLIQENWSDVSRTSLIPVSVKPYALRKGRLVLSCTSLLEAREMLLHKEEIVQEINRALLKEGNAGIRDIDFEVQP